MKQEVAVTWMYIVESGSKITSVIAVFALDKYMLQYAVIDIVLPAAGKSHGLHCDSLLCVLRILTSNGVKKPNKPLKTLL